jgi:hypothetical protein
MSRRLLSVLSSQDVLLVLVTGMFGVVLGAAASGFAFAGEPIHPAIVPDVAWSGLDLDSDAPSHGLNVPAGSFAASVQGRKATAFDLQGPAPTPVVAPTISAERWSGEGGGRMDTVGIRDPYSRRVYLLETASFMHQRAWIALESDVYWMAGLHDQGAPHAGREERAIKSAAS